MITRLCISGYRSLREVRLGLAALNVVTGANGSGKSSLYRALRLLADIAQGQIIQSLAAEGGIQSTLWAGPEELSRAMKQGMQPVQGARRKHPISLKLGFSSEDYGYAIDLGLPSNLYFPHDPEIKIESLWTGEVIGRANVFAQRNGSSVRIRDERGAWRSALQDLAPFDSMMTHGRDPRDAMELLVMRERMRGWRFYDHFRTDTEAPARQRRIGTYTPVLASDGSDLAAAIQTIRHIGNADELEAAIVDAFPGAGVEVGVADGYFEVVMYQRGLLRPLKTCLTDEAPYAGFQGDRVEVDQQGDMTAAQAKICQGLGVVKRYLMIDGLDLQDHLVGDNDVRAITAFQGQVPKDDWKRLLPLIGQAVAVQLGAQAFLVDRLEQARAERTVHP